MSDGRALTDYETRMLAENVALRVERDRAVCQECCWTASGPHSFEAAEAHQEETWHEFWFCTGIVAASGEAQ